jgi:hypothetical protein
MKAPFNNNLPNQANDVMVNPVNPVNPDSNTRLLHASFSPKNGGLTITLIMHISAGQEHSSAILVKSPTHLYRGFSFYNISGIKSIVKNYFLFSFAHYHLLK